MDEVFFDLESPIEEVREKAIISLVKSNDLRAIPAIQKVADNDKSVQIRYFAKKALFQLKSRVESPVSTISMPKADKIKGKSSDQLEDVINNENPDVRLRAVQWIANKRFAKGIPLLTKRLPMEDDNRVKASIILTLGIIGDITIKDILLSYLTDTDPRIRANTIEAIEYLNDETILEHIVPLLKDEDNRVRINCAKTLAKAKKIDIHIILKDMVKSPDVSTRDSAAFALSQIATEKDIPFIAQLLKDEKKTIRLKACEAIEKLAASSKKAADIWNSLKEKDESEGTMDFFTLLDKDKKDPPEPPEVIAIDSDEPKIRLKAIQNAISENNSEIVPAFLRQLYEEEDSYVFSSLMIAIGQLGEKAQVMKLKKFLKEPNHRIRASAIEAMAYMKDPEVWDEFLDMLHIEKNNRALGNILMSLKDYQPIPVKEKLEWMVSSSEFKMKATAIYVISEIADKHVIPLLKILLEDEFSEIQKKALLTLKMLQDSGNPNVESILSEYEHKLDNLLEQESSESSDRPKKIRLAKPAADKKSVKKISKPVEQVVSKQEVKSEPEVMVKEVVVPVSKIIKSEPDVEEEIKLRRKQLSATIFKEIINKRQKNASKRLKKKMKLPTMDVADDSEKIYEIESKKYEFLRKEQIKAVMERIPPSEAVNVVLNAALNSDVSDIHFESGVRDAIRIRAEGQMKDLVVLPRMLFSKMLSRIKIMCEMDITKNLPQDGRFSIKYKDKIIAVRVSSFPSVHGDSIVLRILGREMNLTSLNNLGFFEESLQQIRESLLMPHGMVLITGPTGSGKSSTVYSLLNELNDKSKKIITVEDPVEVPMDGIIQSQINRSASDESDAFTFELALKHILRQDPDVIMIGELRDKESLATAIRAATTGHLVLSTLHSNSVVSTILYLLEMGLTPHIFKAVVNFIISQKLVRKICMSCREDMPLTPEVKEFLNIKPGEEKNSTIFQANPYGCEHCDYSGYLGRTNIYEFLRIDDNIEKCLLSDDCSSSSLELAAKKSGMISLFENGIGKVKGGVITIEELVMNVGNLCAEG